MASEAVGPIGYHSPAAQVEGPGAEPDTGSAGLCFSVFTALMPGTSNSIPQSTKESRMPSASNARLVLCVMCSSFLSFFYSSDLEVL